MSSTVSPHEANRAFYDRISGVYDWLADANEGPARRAGIAALGVKPGERVLELGFGTGNEVLELAELVGPAGSVAGVDVSPGMLQVARQKVDERKPAAAVELTVGDARRLPSDGGSFDAVYTSFTLELFPEDDVTLVLAEVWRVLKPGGRLAVVSMATPKGDESDTVLERGYVWMHRHFPHIVDCRPIDPAAVLTAAGFSDVTETRTAIWTMPVAIVVGKK